MSALACTRVQLELPASAPELERYRDVSDLQVLRATQLPLVRTSVEGAALATLLPGTSKNEHLLRLRAEARWTDGTAMSVADVRAGLRAGLRRFADHAALGSVELLPGDGPVVLHSTLPAVALARFLGQAAFTPRRVSTPGASLCGHFLPDTDALRFLHARSARAVSFEVETDAARAVRRFERGDLDVTCPTSFEVAADAARSPHFVAAQCDVQAALLFNPRTTAWFGSSEGRAALGRRLSELVPPSQLIIDARLRGLAITEPERCTASELELVYTDFWPNRELMRAVSTGLRAFGAGPLRQRCVPLLSLKPLLARQQFDVALVVFPGMFGAELSGWGRVAAAGLALHAEARGAIASAFAQLSSDAASADRQVDLLLQSAPLLPLGRFNSGYLSRERELLCCVDQDCVIGVEALS
jgi:hypothetical protein